MPELLRSWQLTNTRYLVGAAAFNTLLNRRADPSHPEFGIVERFDLAALPGVAQVKNVDEVTVVPKDNGPFALIEYTRSLPRAKLYSRWQVTTNDALVLAQLGAPSFDPEQSVFVDRGAPPATAATNASSGSVVFASYAPKAIVLKADAPAPSVLLLNDRFDPNWHVRVDGKQEALLRCNYLMRGVFLSAGAHTVEFRFQPPIGPLYVSLSAIGVGILVGGVVLVTGRQTCLPAPVPASPSLPAPAPPDVQESPRPTSGGLRRRVGFRGAH